MTTGDSQPDRPDDVEARMRAVAREEARALYGDLAATDADGRTVTLASIQDRIAQLVPDMTRREVLKTSAVAFGYVASGAGLGAAIMHALSTPAAADASGEYGTASDPLNFVRTTELNGGGSNVDVGDTLVPKSDGTQDLGSSSKAWGAVHTESLVIGGTLYEEDDNSPFEFTNQSSATYTVAGSFDELIIIPYSVDTGVGGPNQIRVNGDSGANYDFTGTGDAETTGASQWATGRAWGCDYIKLQDRLGDRIQYRAPQARSGTGIPTRGTNSNVSGPISQFTVLDSDGNNVSMSARVYGRDLA